MCAKNHLNGVIEQGILVRQLSFGVLKLALQANDQREELDEHGAEAHRQILLDRFWGCNG